MPTIEPIKQFLYTKNQTTVPVQNDKNTNKSQNLQDNKTLRLSQEKDSWLVNAMAAYFGASIPANIIRNVSTNSSTKMMAKTGLLGENEAKVVNEGLDKAFNSLKLKDKGVKIYRVTAENFDEVVNITKKDFQKAYLNIFPDEMNKKIASRFLDIVKKGQNEFWYKHSRVIVLPQKGMELTAFHELGHAVDYVFSKTGKFMQKAKVVSLLAPLVLLFGCITKKETETKDKKLTKLDKTKNFIRNNAGKLTAALFIPLLWSEGIATVKGYKIAKKVLPSALSKKMLNTSLWGFLSYAAYSAITAISCFAAVKIKDVMDKY